MDRMENVKEREHLRISKKIHYNLRNSDWVAKEEQEAERSSDVENIISKYANLKPKYR